jgi:hypothetical protein
MSDQPSRPQPIGPFRVWTLDFPGPARAVVVRVVPDMDHAKEHVNLLRGEDICRCVWLECVATGLVHVPGMEISKALGHTIYRAMKSESDDSNKLVI